MFFTFLSVLIHSEIPDKYKIETSLPECRGTDYTKWTDCYGEYVFPIEYKGEWKNGAFHGQGILKEAWGIFIGSCNEQSRGIRKTRYISNGEMVGTFGGELKNDR